MNKVKIENIEELRDWINSHHNFECEIEDDSLLIQIYLTSSIAIWFEEKDSIHDIILRAIKYFEDFSADNELNAFLQSDYVKQYGYTSSECIKMLMSDEQALRELAKELREIIAKQNIN